MSAYLVQLAALFEDIEAHAGGEAMPLHVVMSTAAMMIAGARKTIIVGNGGSAAIASHVANDAIKAAGIRALTFTDAALLTCLANDYGYAEVYAKPVALFTDASDVLIAISSSGNSENIIRAAEEALNRDATVITLTGFDSGNRLRKMGALSFYVPSKSYGPVEVTHMAILHGIMDQIIERRL